MQAPFAALAPARTATDDAARYRVSLLDWLACAAAGSAEPAARAARTASDGLLERVTWAGCAGHVLDYDDTYLPGLVHASAPVAPVALMLGASLEREVGGMLDAYAAGFEATAALAQAGHPALYEGGWHPTAVCGTVGAAVAAGRLIGLAEERVGDALGLALLRAAGLRAGFGSDGKALQVGMAAAAGVQAARLAQCGARVPFDTVRSGEAGFERTFGFEWPAGGEEAAVRDNWIKAYPCCLATHSSIEAALEVRRSGPLPAGATVTVHPIARAAAARDDVSDGLQAKFSIPYLTAFALLRGAPRVSDFDRVDGEARALARRIEVRTDPTLGEMEVSLEVPNLPPVAVEYALGSPARPMDERRLGEKVADLAGNRLDGVLDDPSAPAASVIAAAGLS